MKKIFSLIFAGGLTISSLSAQEKLNVLYVGGSANIETFGTRDLDPPRCGFGKGTHCRFHQISPAALHQSNRCRWQELQSRHVGRR